MMDARVVPPPRLRSLGAFGVGAVSGFVINIALSFASFSFGSYLVENGRSHGYLDGVLQPVFFLFVSVGAAFANGIAFFVSDRLLADARFGGTMLLLVAVSLVASMYAWASVLALGLLPPLLFPVTIGGAGVLCAALAATLRGRSPGARPAWPSGALLLGFGTAFATCVIEVWVQPPAAWFASRVWSFASLPVAAGVLNAAALAIGTRAGSRANEVKPAALRDLMHTAVMVSAIAAALSLVTFAVMKVVPISGAVGIPILYGGTALITLTTATFSRFVRSGPSP